MNHLYHAVIARIVLVLFEFLSEKNQMKKLSFSIQFHPRRLDLIREKKAEIFFRKENVPQMQRVGKKIAIVCKSD